MLYVHLLFSSVHDVQLVLLIYFWSLLDLPVVIPLKKTNSLSLRCFQLWTATQLEVGLPAHFLSLPGFCRSCAHYLNHCYARCTATLLSPEKSFFSQSLSLTLAPFNLFFCKDPWSLGGWVVTQTSHLGLNTPWSLISCILTNCRSLQKGTSLDEVWELY